MAINTHTAPAPTHHWLKPLDADFLRPLTRDETCLIAGGLVDALDYPLPPRG